jgi:phosphinothricin acetyltransferase
MTSPAPSVAGAEWPSVRDAVESDFDRIQKIYAHHVTHGLASFEIDSPDRAEMVRRWREVTAAGLPYIAAEFDNELAGYAYASRFRPRPAYRHTVEDSVYLGTDFVGRGFGRLLLAELIERCTALGYRQMVAVIGDSGNDASINMHLNSGFREAGLLQSTGFKLGRWVDTVLMQRGLGSADSTPPG